MAKCGLDTMTEGVCLVRASDAVIVYANPKFEQMFGYGPGELDGLPVSVVNYENETTRAHDTAARLIARLSERGEAEYEVWNVRKDGTPFWSRAYACTRDHPQHGKVWVSVRSDVTELNRADEALSGLSRRRHISRELYESVAKVLAALKTDLQRLQRSEGVQAGPRTPCGLAGPMDDGFLE